MSSVSHLLPLFLLEGRRGVSLFPLPPPPPAVSVLVTAHVGTVIDLVVAVYFYFILLFGPLFLRRSGPRKRL